MQSIFARIYLGLFAAMLALLMALAGFSYYINKQRLASHIENYYGGTFRLIAAGIGRHQGEDQQRWLNAIEQLTNLHFSLQNTRIQPVPENIAENLKKQGFGVDIEPNLQSGWGYMQLANPQQYLKVKLTDYGSSLVRTTAFLILNELGRHAKEKRLDVLAKLRKYYPYSIALKPLNGLTLSADNRRIIKQGGIAVVLKDAPRERPSLTAYAPFGNSQYVLVVGAVTLFDWFPLSFVVAMVISMLMLMALIVYILVHPLEKRLAIVDQQIETLDHDEILNMPQQASHDAIGKLINTVQNMTVKLHRMVGSQNDMVRAISHELRAPLTRLRFRVENSELAQQDQNLINGIEKDIEELEGLIDEVLTFSRLQQEQPLLHWKKQPIAQFLQRLNQKITINQANQISFQFDDTQQVIADERYLLRAVENLVLNAFKYCKNKVTVSYWQRQNVQYLQVDDDGLGIDEALAETIFEPFQRIDKSRDRKTGGYGLGLAIVKQIAKWHQGEVKLVKSALGGASIQLSWPLIPTLSAQASEVLCDE